MDIKVLIIDDERDTCMLLKKYLAKLGYSVFVASTLQAGVGMIAEVNPDILFLDNNLPDGLGWEKISLIQALQPGLKINLISAYKGTPEVLTDMPAIKIIEKPITLSSLKKFL